MTQTPAFPRVVSHHGPVDADQTIIAINTRDCCISRGHLMVNYGQRKRGMTKAFLAARALLLAAPHPLSSEDIIATIYGADRQAWPKDRTNASARPLFDVRHRTCPRLGLMLERIGQSHFRLVPASIRPGPVVVPQQRRVAEGRTRANRPGMRSFGLELATDVAAPVRAFAVANNVSFQEACRTLMQWGLDSAADAEKAP